jgi:transmembrane sensor
LKTTEFKSVGDLILNDSFREFVAGTNAESKEIWVKWIESNPDRSADVDIAVKVLRTLLSAKKAPVNANKNESVHRLMKQIDLDERISEKTIKTFNSTWLKIAAAGILILGLSVLWMLFHVQSPKNQHLAFNEIVVPLGEKAQIILSDGTHVWINSASRLKYPASFGEISREVDLEGEAFFDVTKKHGKTFVVKTRDVKVNVMGTAFNVKCYPGDNKTQTTVVRGMVKVENNYGRHKTFIIQSNEMATVQQKSHEGSETLKITPITVNKVNPENLVSWKNQMLVFAGESFEDLAVKMERWFNVNIKIDDEELKSERYNGKFVHNETVYQVLEAIKVTTPITYKVEKDTIVIAKKHKNK